MEALGLFSSAKKAKASSQPAKTFGSRSVIS